MTTCLAPNDSNTDSRDCLGCLTMEPAAEYHAKSGEYLSSHLLADFRKSPLLYHRRRCGLVPNEDRPAFILGRAAHTVILEGMEAFQGSFAVGGPVNPKTGLPYGSSTKAWAEWAEAQNKDVLTNEQYSLVMNMAHGVRSHAIAQDLLSQGAAERVVRTEYCRQPSQIRMDWFDPHCGVVDLKTCDDLTWFEADARRYGYAHQLAFYRAVLAQVIGLLMPVHLIAVEKKQPFRCGVWKVTNDVLTAVQRENEAAIQRLQRCLEADHWPSGYEDCRFLDCL